MNSLYDNDRQEPVPASPRAYTPFNEQTSNEPANYESSYVQDDDTQAHAEEPVASANIGSTNDSRSGLKNRAFAFTKKQKMVAGGLLGVLLIATVSVTTLKPGAKKKAVAPAVVTAPVVVPPVAAIVPTPTPAEAPAVMGTPTQSVEVAASASVDMSSASPASPAVASSPANSPSNPSALAPATITAAAASDSKAYTAEEQKQLFKRAEEMMRAQELLDSNKAKKQMKLDAQEKNQIVEAGLASNEVFAEKMAALEAKVRRLEAREARLLQAQKQKSVEPKTRSVEKNTLSNDNFAAFAAKARRDAARAAVASPAIARDMNRYSALPNVMPYDGVRVVGVTMRDGNHIAIIESNGTKYLRGTNEVIPGLGPISKIVIQNGSPVVEINGVIYRQ